MRKILLAAALAVVMSPGQARADWLLTPFVGTTFGGDTIDQQLTWGGTLGWMGAGALGFEVDFGYTPEFFETSDGELDFIDDSNVTTLMANLIVGAPIGGGGPSVRPYVSGGIGLLRTHINDVDDFFDVDNSSFGLNVGAGIMGFFSEHVGIRGDVRYFRSLEDPEEDTEFDVGLADFDFWRGTGGVVFRF